MSSGEEVRLARKARGLSQRALAEQVGVNESTIWRIEKDAHKDPTTLETIQSHLRIGPYASRDQLGKPLGPTLKSATDTQLIAELADRMARLRAEARPSPTFTSEVYEAASDELPDFVTEALSDSDDHRPGEVAG